MKYLKTYKRILLESQNWSPEEILRELSMDLSDAGLYVNFPDDRKFDDHFYLSIEDTDKVFCKNYPEDDMDWLYGKPIIDKLFSQLSDFGLVRDKDYKVYAGGLGLNVVFNDKNIVKLQEELLPSTYISAAGKLKQKGHVRRAGELEAWKKEVEEKERQIKYDQKINEMKKWGQFRLRFCRTKWNAQTKSNSYEPFFEGNFYIQPSFPYDWFGDMMLDSENDNLSLSLPIEFGVTPADGETKLEFEKCKLAGEIWEGEYWPTRVWIQIFEEGRRIPEKPRCNWESVDSDIFFFSTRAEAIRFKKLLADALVGKNDWGKNRWYEKGLISAFETFFKKDKEWRERSKAGGDNVLDPYFTEDDLQRVSDSVKALSLNDLYLD